MREAPRDSPRGVASRAECDHFVPDERREHGLLPYADGISRVREVRQEHVLGPSRRSVALEHSSGRVHFNHRRLREGIQHERESFDRSGQQHPLPLGGPTERRDHVGCRDFRIDGAVGPDAQQPALPIHHPHATPMCGRRYAEHGCHIAGQRHFPRIQPIVDEEHPAGRIPSGDHAGPTHGRSAVQPQQAGPPRQFLLRCERWLTDAGAH